MIYLELPIQIYAVSLIKRMTFKIELGTCKNSRVTYVWGEKNVEFSFGVGSRCL